MADEKLSKIKQQVEYYFSDKNLAQDAFFHNKISGDKEGWVDLQFLMNCNKVKQLTSNIDDIEEAVKDSTEVEASKGMAFIHNLPSPTIINELVITLVLGGIRRKDNKPLPKLVLKEKKREEKEEVKDDGSLKDRDFKNPKILTFTLITKAEEIPSWRDLEKNLQEAYPSIKVLYSRMTDTVGQMAVSSFKIDGKTVEELKSKPFKSDSYEYQFSEPSEDDLKEFWEKHGSHYEMVTKQKMRKLKKRKREEAKDNGGHKAQKTTEEDHPYTIAGTTYANITKVKSKAKAIMNLKESGQKLEGFEEEFMKEIIKHHAKHEEKMKNFSHFVVDEHPTYENTR